MLLSRFLATTHRPSLDYTDVVSTTAGLEADWHFRPRRTIDPWVSLGAGLRKTWFVDQQREGTDNLAGVELARLQVGVDDRLTPGFSIGPVIAANAADAARGVERPRAQEATIDPRSSPG